MPISALIIFDTLAAGEPEPFLMRVGGLSLFERLVSQLCAARVVQILVFSPTPSADLSAICAKLDRAQIRVRIVRGSKELADSLHPLEDVWFVDGPILVPQTVFASLSEASEACLFTVPAKVGDRFERIDAEDHWAGLGRVDGALVRDTAMQLGEWALAPTLLRRAIQNGAKRHPMPINSDNWNALRPATAEEFADTQLMLIDPLQDKRENGALTKALNRLIYKHLGRPLLASNISYDMLNILSILLIICCIYSSCSGMLLLAFFAFCLVCPIISVAGLLGKASTSPPSSLKLELLRDISLFPWLWALAIVPTEPAGELATAILAFWLAVQWAFACFLRKGRGFVDALALWLLLGIFSLINVALIGFGLCITILIAEQAWLEFNRERSAS